MRRRAADQQTSLLAVRSQANRIRCTAVCGSPKAISIEWRRLNPFLAVAGALKYCIDLFDREGVPFGLPSLQNDSADDRPPGH